MKQLEFLASSLAVLSGVIAACIATHALAQSPAAIQTGLFDSCSLIHLGEDRIRLCASWHQNSQKRGGSRFW